MSNAKRLVIAVCLAGLALLVVGTECARATGQEAPALLVLAAVSPGGVTTANTAPTGRVPVLPLLISPPRMYPEYPPPLPLNPAMTPNGPDTQAKNRPAFWYDGTNWHLGYALANEREGMAFIRAYKQSLELGEEPTGDLKVARGRGNGGGNVIHRLSKKVAPYYTPDIHSLTGKVVTPSEIPVSVSRPVNGGGNVVYLDGRQEYIPYPGQFPMTPIFIRGLEELNALAKHAASR